jgi:predicted O-linked N-acetylglucosamine transferase (SPINDLY family)
MMCDEWLSSADFNKNAVGLFVTSLLKYFDTSQFEVYCYYNNHESDIYPRPRLRGRTGWTADVVGSAFAIVGKTVEQHIKYFSSHEVVSTLRLNRTSSGAKGSR